MDAMMDRNYVGNTVCESKREGNSGRVIICNECKYSR